MTGEEATARGYRRVSNKYRLVARIDRVDWLEVLASRLHRAPADFYVHGTRCISPGWFDHYRRVYSNDKAILTPEEFEKVPASGGDATGYVPLDAAGAAITPPAAPKARLPLTPCEAVALDALRVLKAIEWIEEDAPRGAGGTWRHCPGCGNIGAHTHDACQVAEVIGRLEWLLRGEVAP